MKYLVLFLVLLVGAPFAHADTYRITIRNEQPCAFIDTVVFSSFADSQQNLAQVDLIRYIRSSNAEKAIYLYRGPALFDLWTGDSSKLPPGVLFSDQTRKPAVTEIGRVAIAGGRIDFEAVKSKRLKNIFSKADAFMALYRSEGSMTKSVHKTYDVWLQDRFKDIAPDPFVVCVDPCSCQVGRYVFYQ